MTLLGKERDKCRTQAQEDRNTGAVAWKHVLEPKSAHIPCLGRFRRGTSQSDMIDLLQMHHKMLANDPSSATAATRRADCNRDGPPPFAAAHGSPSQHR